MEDKQSNRKEQGGQINCIDGIKGIGACLIAFVWHYQHFSPQEGYPFYRLFVPFYDHGDRVVELFILLSGFGMVLGYQKRILAGTISFREYIFKRIEKLYPLMWLTLVVTVILQWGYLCKIGTTFVYPYFDVWHFLLNILGLQNSIIGIEWSFNSPSWCISILLMCYLLFYWVVYTKRGKEQEFLGVNYIILSLLGLFILITQVEVGIINSLMGRGVSCFFLGALLALVYDWRDRLYTERIGYVCLAFLVVVCILVKKYGYGIFGNFELTVIIGIVPTFVLSVLFIPWLNALFALPLLRCLGKISFSIYLWHFPVQCMWKLIEVYGGMEINYSRRIIWILYALSVLIVALIYEFLVARKINKFWSFFVREK